MRTVEGMSLALGALLWACSPTTGGQGSGEPTSDDDGEDTGGMQTGSGDTAGPGSGDDATPGTSGDSTGAPTCDDPDTMVLWAADGELGGLMGFGVSEELGGIEVARSWAAGDGTLTLRFELACEGPVYLWALVYDRVGGVMMENADSFFVALDDDAESVWWYGCDTPSGEEFVWQWDSLGVWTETACDHDPLVPDLGAGQHALTLRNRENGLDNNVAAIAAVVVSHDPTIDPLQFLDPDAVGG